MNEITELFNLNWVAIIIGIFAILFAVKELIEIIGFFKNKFRITTGEEEEKLLIKERLTKLETRNDQQDKTLEKIKESLQRIEHNQQISEEVNNKTLIAQLGERLYSLHSRFMKQGTINSVDYEMFATLSEDYINRGGNHSIKNKIIPDIEKLQIKD